ncbi:MAG: hypothetical protein PF569_01035 [Candidatus Woesearchaeota archaeon]|jgi:hypothetical protein|nr:hypothetical protein [Candidatus Woesearchaeota archaeon]
MISIPIYYEDKSLESIIKNSIDECGLKYLSTVDLSKFSTDQLEYLFLEYLHGISYYHIHDYLHDKNIFFKSGDLKKEKELQSSFNKYILIKEGDLPRKVFEEEFFEENIVFDKKIKTNEKYNRKSIIGNVNKSMRFEPDLIYRGVFKLLSLKVITNNHFRDYLGFSDSISKNSLIIQNTLVKFID